MINNVSYPFYVATIEKRNLGGYFVGKGWSSVKRRVSGSAIKVPAKPLDKIVEELGISNVSWIKVDVEGAEYEVLQGSKKIIEQHRPKIIAECTMKQTAVLQFMEELGYDPILISPTYRLIDPYYFFRPRVRY